MRRPRTLTLRRGKILYHGTNTQDEFDVPDGPAWFSDTESVAREFATWHGDSGRPRVLSFKLTHNLRLARIDDVLDFDKATRTEDAVSEYADPTELANEVCRGYDGWIIPTNYPDGADIMICSPSGWLERVGTQVLDGTRSWACCPRRW